MSAATPESASAEPAEPAIAEPVCGARLKKGGRCTRRPTPGLVRCRQHGGHARITDLIDSFELPARSCAHGNACLQNADTTDIMGRPCRQGLSRSFVPSIRVNCVLINVQVCLDRNVILSLTLG